MTSRIFLACTYFKATKKLPYVSEMTACSDDTNRQNHQCYTRMFFVRTLFRQLFSSYMYVEKFAETTKNLYVKY